MRTTAPPNIADAQRWTAEVAMSLSLLTPDPKPNQHGGLCSRTCKQTIFRERASFIARSWVHLGCEPSCPPQLEAKNPPPSSRQQSLSGRWADFDQGQGC